MDNKNLKQLFEEAKSDPSWMTEDLKRIAGQSMSEVDSYVSQVLKMTREFASESSEQNEYWGVSIMIALAKATCLIIRSMELSLQEQADLFSMYYDELLPLCKNIEWGTTVTEDISKAENLTANVTEAIMNTDMTDDEIVDNYFSEFIGLPTFDRNEALELVGNLRMAIDRKKAN